MIQYYLGFGISDVGSTLRNLAMRNYKQHLVVCMLPCLLMSGSLFRGIFWCVFCILGSRLAY